MKHVYFTILALSLFCIQPVTALSISLTEVSKKPKASKGDVAVDMGLSVKWASCNLGENGFVSSPKEAGAFYAWGEVETKSDFKWENYKWSNYKTITKYYSKDHKGRLEKVDDAASVRLGSNWRIPTAQEFDELIKNCEVTEMKQKGVHGLLFTSKINGNSIFFPATVHNYNPSRGVNSFDGFYWCDDLEGEMGAKVFRFRAQRSDDFGVTHYGRYLGYAIRPVFDDGSFFDDVCSNIEDEVFRSFCFNSFDRNKDGRLSLAEASLVGTIDVRGKNIHSLAGIEYFENLTSLLCDRNQLTQIDVSKNTLLEKLTCDENQLTQIDVSNNAMLKVFGCNSNKLTSLDVSKNTKLKELGCNSNKLTHLDVSKNTALQLLYCAHNQLTSLNLGGCSSLTRLSCKNNKLTSLDISSNTALEELSCQNNELASLDISRNRALWSLLCYNNHITNLDVSKNTKLSYLVQHNSEEEKAKQRESTKETVAVWVSDTNTIEFTLYVDGTADIYVLGVGRSSTWEEKNGMVYVRGFGSTQAYVINQNGELYALERSGRLTRFKNSASSPLGVLTGSDGVIMYKR